VATPGETFTRRLTQVRENRGWSKQQLTDALGRVGYPIERMAVTRAEQGDRKITIDDLFGFAAALDVPPWWLVLPLDSDAPMRIGNLPTTAGAVEAWLSGDHPLPFPGGDPEHFFWGTGPTGRNTAAQVLRGLVKHAEEAETPAEILKVVQAGVSALQGLEPVLQLDTDRNREEN
jgi:transcriptional regulator with XRE-family HTH domain